MDLHAKSDRNIILKIGTSIYCQVVGSGVRGDEGPERCPRDCWSQCTAGFGEALESTWWLQSPLRITETLNSGIFTPQQY